jgi:alkylhydroperoxidase/carboxymuconolactone decarboxylase family protein YurZ
MTIMSSHPLQPIKDHDPGLFEEVRRAREFALQEGALPVRIKYLIAMALDAAHGTSTGAASLARQALEHGATREELLETLRVAHYISGAGSVYTAAAGLGEILGKPDKPAT